MRKFLLPAVVVAALAFYAYNRHDVPDVSAAPSAASATANDAVLANAFDKQISNILVEVAFSGEYEWGSKGGVVHWTHRDPNGRHQAGWLKHNGRSFQ